MKSACILIVDDDTAIRELIAMYLQEQRFDTVEAGYGEAAIRQFQRRQPDLILLDVLMPGMDGFAVCRDIRRQSKVPIVFLTSKWETEDVVAGLESGGDDYIVKPFHPDVLIARVKANLRRVYEYEAEEVLAFGDLHIHRDMFEARCRGKDIPFLAKEIKLLIFLAEHPRQVFHAEQLYEQLWDNGKGDARTVMVHISNIRRKLAEYAPGTVKIETVKGIGYRLVEE